jgi:RND family efflux transporter MFP subunit
MLSHSRIFTAILMAISICNQAAAVEQRAPTPVSVFEVVEQELSTGQSFVASVLPSQRAIIGSPVDGRVIEIVAQEGDRVKAFTPLVKLLTTTIEQDLAALQAELELRKQELAELENGTRPAEIEQAEAKMLGAKARLDYTQARFRRLEKLHQSQAVSQEELDEAAAVFDESRQIYIDAKAAHELAVEGPRPEKIAQARALVEQQQALVIRLQGIIHRHAIITRFDGYVAAKLTEVGAWVKAGDPVMEVVALDEVEIEAFVAEQHASFVRPGMSVRVEIPALPDQVFLGTVKTIIPQADTRARTFPVKIRVENKFEATAAASQVPVIKAGMYARAELPTGSVQRALVVPKDALVLGGPRPLVFVVDSLDQKLGTVAPVPVELGVASDNLIQVKGDLKPGQWVVVEGNERLKPEQEVVITSIAQPQLAAVPAN